MFYKMLELDDSFIVGKLDQTPHDGVFCFTVTLVNKKTKRIKIRVTSFTIKELFKGYLDHYFDVFKIPFSNRKEQELTEEEYNRLMNAVYMKEYNVTARSEIFPNHILEGVSW